MTRYRTRITDETLFVETPNGWLEVGEMADIVALVGGETYTLSYDERAQAASWLRTDPDGTISFDVRETLAETTFDDEFVSNLLRVPSEESTEDGVPQRTAHFADLITTIWDSKGHLD